jgi:hypothetical protein
MDNSSSPDDGSFFATNPDRDVRLHMAGSADIHRAGLTDLPKNGTSYVRLVLRGTGGLAHGAFIRPVRTDDIAQLSGQSKKELLAFFVAPFSVKEQVP